MSGPHAATARRGITSRLLSPRMLQPLLLIAIAVFLVSVPAWAGDYWTRIFTGVCMWAGLAMAWVMAPMPPLMKPQPPAPSCSPMRWCRST